MAKCFEKRHAAQEKHDDLGSCEKCVNLPQHHGCIADARFQFVRNRAGNFGFVELHAPDAQERKDGNGQYDDPHASQPLNETAPEQQPLGHSFDMVEYGCPRGAETGNGFEQGIAKTGDFTSQEKGQGTKKSHGSPTLGDDGHAFTMADVGDATGAKDGIQRYPRPHGEAHGYQTGHHTGI